MSAPLTHELLKEAGCVCVCVCVWERVGLHANQLLTAPIIKTTWEWSFLALALLFISSEGGQRARVGTAGGVIVAESETAARWVKESKLPKNTSVSKYYKTKKIGRIIFTWLHNQIPLRSWSLCGVYLSPPATVTVACYLSFLSTILKPNLYVMCLTTITTLHRRKSL